MDAGGVDCSLAVRRKATRAEERECRARQRRQQGISLGERLLWTLLLLSRCLCTGDRERTAAAAACVLSRGVSLCAGVIVAGKHPGKK